MSFAMCCVCARVCMPTLQRKSRMATGCFLFMWRGALVHKGTLRFWRSIPLWLFDAAALSLGDPPGRLNYIAAPPPPSFFKAFELGPCCTDAWSAQPHKEPPHTEKPCTVFYHSALKGPFFRLSALLLISFFCAERCVCFAPSVSSEVTVLKDGLGSEFKDLRQASYLLLPDGLFIPHFLTS